jgi:phosphoglycerol transferase MdoB-like AlkP superfamily enzyme
MEGNGAWVEALGFTRVVGGNSPEFAGAPRFVFDMPTDEALYTLAFDHVQKQASPFLLVLFTMSLHKPYELPDARDEVPGDPQLSQLRYVDRTTFDFYNRLRDARFFDDGVLMIVGDHRRMTPLEPAEERTLGLDATGRVVAALVGAGIEPGQMNDALLNQTDLFSILYDVLDGKEVAEVSTYSKAQRLGFERPFTVTVADGASGIFTVRHQGAPPRELSFRPTSEPTNIAVDPLDEPVAAYVILHTDWLQSAQKATGQKAASPEREANAR